ncbi:MAG: tannase/feruloyl esterase family alpha/beta hydrolase [Gammaproteobacteria bacterium]
MTTPSDRFFPRHRAFQIFFALLIGVSACSVLAQISSQIAQDDDACSGIKVPSRVTLEASPSWQQFETLPRYCRVRGTIAERIQFEMRLPEEWNGRFMMAGCGGYCGTLLPDKPGHSNSINEALKRGYAAISHDSGHQADSWEVDWAYDDTEALELWAHKVLPLVAGVGIELTEAMYNESPDYRYFSGCSNGGRLGLMAAQRYPDLFDGIAAGAPILDLSGTAGLWGNWMIDQTGAEKSVVLPTEKVAFVKEVVMAQCDAIDGQSDGIINDPHACSVDFTDFQCSDGEMSDSCLTEQQSNMLNSLYGGVRNNKGEVVNPALLFGSEHYADIWHFGSIEMPAWGVRASQGYRQLLSNDLYGKETPLTISTDEMEDWIERSSIPALTDAPDSDLSGLRKADTKLMIYQGWSDPLIIPDPVINYYEQAIEHGGNLDKLKENARLFMLPGWGHCWERAAEAPDQFNPLQVLEPWVEQGEAPESFVAEQHNEQGEVVRSRPICAYPQVARYQSGRSPARAESYQCALPEK